MPVSPSCVGHRVYNARQIFDVFGPPILEPIKCIRKADATKRNMFMAAMLVSLTKKYPKWVSIKKKGILEANGQRYLKCGNPLQILICWLKQHRRRNQMFEQQGTGIARVTL